MDAERGASIVGPSVTVIVPTIPGREALAEVCREYIETQSYPSIELLVDCDDSVSIGAHRNALCARANGEIIVIADDDDVHLGTRVADLVDGLRTNPTAMICGSSGVWVYDWTESSLGFLRCQWVRDNTIAFRKEAWSACPFDETVTVGEVEPLIERYRDRTVDLAARQVRDPHLVYSRHQRNTSCLVSRRTQYRPPPEVAAWMGGSIFARHRSAIAA